MHWTSLPVLGVAVVALAAASAATVAGVSRSPHSDGRSAACTGPALPGTVVDVTLVDMGTMLGRDSTGGVNPMMGSVGVGSQAGLMRLIATPSEVASGTVSFRIHNRGTLTHELVVLPAGQPTGRRPVGADARISEAGSLGEASRDCGAGAGDGIPAGSTSWVTLDLAPGHDELVCNLPGHYAAGMYSSLSVE